MRFFWKYGVLIGDGVGSAYSAHGCIVTVFTLDCVGWNDCAKC